MRHTMTWINILALIAIVVVYGGHPIRDRVCDRLLPNNRVNRQQYLEQIATGEGFLVIYSVLRNPIVKETKVKRFFDPNGDYGSFSYAEVLNEESIPKACGYAFAPDFGTTDITEVRRAGQCRRVDTYFRIGEDDEKFNKARFFSQDPSKYFWFFACDLQFKGGVSTYENCTRESKFELHIKDTRLPPIDPPTLGTELNLNGIPWGLALQDLKDFTGLTLSELEYTWLGPECGEGNVTSSAFK